MWPSDVASVGCALFTPHHIQSEMDGIHPSIPSRLVSWLIDGRKCGARSFRFLVFAHVVVVIVVVVVDDDDVVAVEEILSSFFITICIYRSQCPDRPQLLIVNGDPISMAGI